MMMSNFVTKTRGGVIIVAIVVNPKMFHIFPILINIFP